VLRSRCHEQERVPYNALDGIVDGLARFLATRRAGKLQKYVPPGIAQLARLFPVLEVVAPIEQAVFAERDRQAPPDRAEAFLALAELLARLTSRRPLVLVVDDLQWADADSLTLLGELLRPPRAPPLLFLATARPAADAATPPLAALGATHMALGGLAPDDAAALLERLLAQHHAPPTLDRAAILAEAEGHPLFLDELVRHLAHAPTATGARTLNDVISARVAVLPLAARTLLSVVAVAGVPVAQSLAARVAELESADYAAQLETLRSGQLVRVAGVRREDTIEPYHDRVRETVYQRIGAGERVRLHRKLGLLLEEAGASADLLFSHFEKAGERVLAARHAETAAAAATRALAFDRAAELYDHALVLGRHSDADRGRLLAALGDALTNAGRPQEAAAAFLDAATTPGRSRDELLELHRRAAEQLLMGGNLEAGLDATRALLAALDLPFPETFAGAMAKLAWRQARLTLRPLRWPKRQADALPADARRLLDVYWSVSAGLGLVDSVRGVLFAIGGALVALDYGDEARIARALSTAGIAEAGLGSRRRATRLVDAAVRAADSDGGDRARFYGTMARQGCTFLIDNDWPRVLQLGDEAARLWRASGHVAAGFEWDATEQFNCWALDNMGRLREVNERVPLRIRSAQRSGNRFMEIAFRSFFANVHLTVDDAETARRDVSDAIAGWLPGRDDFGNQHYLALRSLTYIALYAGDVDAVADALTAKWQRFYGTLLRHVLLLQQDGRMLTAQLALARAVNARQRGDATAAAALVRSARHDAAALARVKLPMARAALPRVLAGLAALAGDDAAAVGHLREALVRAEANHAALYAAAIRRRLGALVGGSEGAALVAAADAYFAGEGVRHPARMTAALVSGWPHPG
ncbi:MAG TPA: AAA family ATPase, partial [Polyangia bacterium]|nr:AAA family ATPase [Polyangia bacterium]